jgi:HK97 gp10 family phage protein
MTALEGTAALSKQLAELGKAVSGRVLKAAVTEAMMPTYVDALGRVPVGSRSHRTYKGRTVEPGFAQMNVRLKTWVPKDKSAATAMVGVSPEAYYVLQFIELGTSKLPAAPWLLPAFEANKDEAVQRIAREFRTRIERIARRRAARAGAP